MTKFWKNVAILSVCQMLFMSTASLMITIGGLAGHSLASDKSLATAPVSAAVFGTALAAIPASMLMGRTSRRVGFILGSCLAVLGGLIGIVAISLSHFWLLVTGFLITGMFTAFGQLYRFAAADSASERLKGKAISYVLAGGVAAGFTGPQLAKWSKDLIPNFPYLGCFIIVIGLALTSMILLAFLDIPKPDQEAISDDQRPLTTIIRKPIFIAAAGSGIIGYAIMSLLMTGTPLAMMAHGHPFNDSATVIQWHVVGMFAPSFFTGHLITRFGLTRIITVGIILDLLSVGVGLTGTGFFQFWACLILLGFGWNFMFIGGSTLLTYVYKPQERAKIQAANDFLIFAAVAIASLSSGQLLYYWGWKFVLLTAFPFLSLALIMAFWWVAKKPKIGSPI